MTTRDLQYRVLAGLDGEPATWASDRGRFGDLQQAMDVANDPRWDWARVVDVTVGGVVYER